MVMDVMMWLWAMANGGLTGFSKTSGLAVIGIFNVTIMSMIFPAKEAVGILLPMLIIGDVIAVAYYRRSVVWKHLFSLMPWVLAGILLGYGLLWIVDSGSLRWILGLIVLSLVVLQIVKDRLGSKLNEALPNSPWFIGISGILAGFTTMVGNVAGVVMSVYLLAKRLPKQEFVGTGAWFYLFVNVIKVPFYVHLGMITLNSVTFNAMAVPAIVFGAFLGIKVLPLIPQKLFQGLILFLGAVGAVRLIVPEDSVSPLLFWTAAAGISVPVLLRMWMQNRNTKRSQDRSLGA